MSSPPEQVLSTLKKEYPNAKYYLNFSTPIELVVAGILSAQMRDTGVNAATEVLFKNYKTAADYATASIEELYPYVQNITYARGKLKNIIAACKILHEKYKGEVPRTLDQLTELPGIGPKTALVILANAFDIVQGVVVDTHVIRVSYRLGWTEHTNPEKIRRDLETIFPKPEWKKLPWVLKAHGRAICKAPVPACSKCPVNKLCPKAGVIKST